MGGFFGFFDYSKPGPGVAKDAPPKPRIVIFFEIFSRKFWHLIKLNMMFFVFNIPAILLAVLLAFVSQVLMNKNPGGDLILDLIFKFVISAFALCIPIITVGPAQAGFTYVLRNFAREEHAFIWEDFKEHSLKNFKEGTIISLIDAAVVVLIAFDIYVYSSIGKGNILVTIASVLLLLSLIIYLIMHMYIYPMLVSFKLSVKQIYKNALIFSIIKFFPNLGIVLLCIAIILATFYMPIVGFILFPLITMSTIGLITNFYVYPHLKKYMFDRVENNQDEENQRIQ